MSELSKIADAERANQLAKNSYTVNKPYNATSPDAKSDGDDKGKDGEGNNVGSKTDIANRTVQVAKNKYSASKPYGLNSI